MRRSTDVTHEDKLTCLNEYSDCQNSCFLFLFLFFKNFGWTETSDVLKYGLIL